MQIRVLIYQCLLPGLIPGKSDRTFFEPCICPADSDYLDPKVLVCFVCGS